MRRIYCRLILAVFVLAAAVGCTQPEPEVPATADLKTIPDPISLLLVDTPGVGEELARRWSAERNGTVEYREITAAQLLDEQRNLEGPADIIIYPGILTSDLVAAGRLIDPLSDEIWQSKELETRGLLRHCRKTLPRFGDQRWAVPLSNPNLLMLVRADVLAAVGEAVPDTWDELVKLAKKLAEVELVESESGAPLPTAIGIPDAKNDSARMLLAIAASSIRRRGSLDSVFDRRTLKPLIESPPWIESLQILGELQQLNAARVSDPPAAARLFFEGQLAIAIGWPAKAALDEQTVAKFAQGSAECTIERLPGSRRKFDATENQFVELDEVSRVELVGIDSRQASIMQTAAQPTAAQRFLVWLGSKQTINAIFADTPFGSPIRSSDLGNPQRWTGEVLDVETGYRFADLCREINDQQIFLTFPRIKNSSQYLELLDSQIDRFFDGKLDAINTLRATAEQWEQLTESIGRVSQVNLLRQDR